jgi:hypothetical protein
MDYWLFILLNIAIYMSMKNWHTFLPNTSVHIGLSSFSGHLGVASDSSFHFVHVNSFHHPTKLKALLFLLQDPPLYP